MRNQNTRSFLVESTREFLNDKESFDNIVKQNIRHLDLLTDKK
jgi:hypothetical protein